MYSFMEIPDYKIIAINCGNGENESNSIIYKDAYNQLRTIDLDACAENFQKDNQNAGFRCIGDRDITKKYFLLYTSSVKTVISFKRFYVFNMSGKNLMYGHRISRFMQFQNLLLQIKFTTCDLS